MPVCSEKLIVLAVYPELINKMVVLMMDASSDKRASESIFQCIVNLWRTFSFLSFHIDGLRAELVGSVQRFISDETSRLKTTTPNIGHTLVIATLLRGDEVAWSDFLDVYEVESSLRRVYWIQKNRVALNEQATYDNAEIGRKNSIFQVYSLPLSLPPSLSPFLPHSTSLSPSSRPC